VVLAELGSLSVEFTRLAQITKEAKYYDAIARITNEFDIWQNNTRMPGLWPNSVDASGCKKPDMSSHTTPYNGVSGATDSQPLNMIEDSASAPSLLDGGPAKKAVAVGAHTDPESSGSDTTNVTTPKPADSGDSPNAEADKITAQAAPKAVSAPPAKGAIGKREIEDETGLDPHPEAASKPPECEPQGLASPPFTNQEEFAIGGQADSTYEYLPKEYLLLGGLEDKYQSMYEMFADATTKNLLFRPMIPDEKRNILHAGKAKVTDKEKPFKLTPEGTHLTCFAGGMYALGAKVFGRKGDMDIAKKLTDGCVWAYESTTTGIMPESYLTMKCPDANNCPWNETLWHEALDPYAEMREKQRLQAQQTALENDKKALLQEAEEKAAAAEPSNLPPEPPKSALRDEKVQKVEAASGAEKTAATEFQTSRTKADEAVSKPIADKPLDPEQEKAEKAVSKPTEGTIAKKNSIEVEPEENAEISTSKPVQGAPPPKSLAKRQLGDINEAPLAAPVKPPASEAAAPETAPSKSPVADKTTAEQHLDNAHGVSNSQAMAAPQSARHPNNTAKAPVPVEQPYHEPPLPTHEEFVAAKIKDERIPEGMTKIDGRRYLLR
jgi:mannosyl-oligosaccharide alpha-1,2-mannosidase